MEYLKIFFPDLEKKYIRMYLRLFFNLKSLLILLVIEAITLLFFRAITTPYHQNLYEFFFTWGLPALGLGAVFWGLYLLRSLFLLPLVARNRTMKEALEGLYKKNR